jgi:hypothetical protein
MTEKQSKKNRFGTVFQNPYSKLVIPAGFWLSLVMYAAISYGDLFWLWISRAFSLSFILYTIAVIYGLYVYLPRFGAGLGGLIMQGIQGFFVQSKMKDLSVKGVEARQLKAENEAGLAMVAAVDPLKAVFGELLEGFLSNMDSIPKSVRPAISGQIGKAVQASPINFTAWAVSAIDKRFPQAKISENLKALGVITNAEKVA